eukprot:4635784-Amphidinium_carterae.1
MQFDTAGVLHRQVAVALLTFVPVGASVEYATQVFRFFLATQVSPTAVKALCALKIPLGK